MGTSSSRQWWSQSNHIWYFWIHQTTTPTPPQYKLVCQPQEHANIPPDLQRVRDTILNGTYDENAAGKLTIQKIHQLATQSISPCTRRKCGCANGKCKPGCCGCVKNNSKCMSAFSCNGNCEGNSNNGKWYCFGVTLILISNELILIYQFVVSAYVTSAESAAENSWTWVQTLSQACELRWFFCRAAFIFCPTLGWDTHCPNS